MILEMPSLPFEVYDAAYNKSVHVVSSCKEDTWKSLTLMIEQGIPLPAELILKTAGKMMDMPGKTRLQVCRNQSEGRP